MASNDEGQGSGDCDDAYQAADEFFSLTDDQPMLLLMREWDTNSCSQSDSSCRVYHFLDG